MWFNFGICPIDGDVVTVCRIASDTISVIFQCWPTCSFDGQNYYFEIDMMVYLFWCWSTKKKTFLLLFHFAAADGFQFILQVNKCIWLIVYLNATIVMYKFKFEWSGKYKIDFASAFHLNCIILCVAIDRTTPNMCDTREIVWMRF